MPHEIRVGTSGWSYADWRGSFYPEGLAAGDYLGHYAGEFCITEVDSTWYRSPSRRTVQGWADKTPPEFRFALKVPREITHERVLEECEQPMDEFLAALEPLGSKLQCLLLQFGYFNRTAFRSAATFFERLAQFLGKYSARARFAVELRNKNWINAGYFERLREHGAVAALVEHAWLPPIDRLVEEFNVITGPFAYVRLIGDREGIEKVTQTWDRAVVDRSADLKRIARALRQIAQTVDVITFVNNHYAGHGPATCRELQDEL